MSKNTKLYSVKLTLDNWTELMLAVPNPNAKEQRVLENVQGQLVQAELDDYSYEKDYGVDVDLDDDGYSSVYWTGFTWTDTTSNGEDK